MGIGHLSVSAPQVRAPLSNTEAHYFIRTLRTMNITKLARTWAIAVSIAAYVLLGPALAGVMQIIPEIVLVAAFPISIGYLLLKLHRAA